MIVLIRRCVVPLAAAALCLLSTGCGSLTGLDGTSSYGCKAPEGVKCDSVSGTYYNALQNNLPSQRRSSQGRSAPPEGPAGAPPAPQRSPAMFLASATVTPPTGTAEAAVPAPLRAAPRVMRLWVKPWQDADDDLNDQSFVYLKVDNGRWLVDYVQRQARDPYLPVRPANSVTHAAAPATGNDGAKASPPPAAANDGTPLSNALRALQSRSTTPTAN